MELLRSLINSANDILWGAPMLAMMLASGAYFSVRTGFFQLRRAGTWMKSTIFSRGNSSSGGSITPFQAMSSALAATLGTGNIAGVATALSTGGAGAVFWMWISAVLGMMTGYAENLLGCLYRRRKPDGSWQGGAMWYIRGGLSEKRVTKPLAKPLAAVFAGACVLSSFGMGNIVQMNCAAQSIQAGFGIPGVVTAVVLALVTGAVFFTGREKNGAQRTAAVTAKIVPVMSALYIAAAVYILAVNITRLPDVMGLIFRSAFGLEAAAGGVSGYMVKQAVSMGFRRGVFSNEAGLGSSVAAHASMSETEPCVHGMWSIFEVFFDTIVMCSMTAFVLLASPCREIPMQEAFNNVSAQPQYFRLTECDSLVTSGAPLLTVGSGKTAQMRTVYGEKFTVLISESGVTCSNVMKLTGIPHSTPHGTQWEATLEEVTGAELMTIAFSSVFGNAAGMLLSAAVALFAFTTVIGWGSFGAQAAEYLAGERAVIPFRVVYTLLAALGGVIDMSSAWGIADMFNGMMAAVNLPVVLALSGTVIRRTREFTQKKRAEKPRSLDG